MNARSITALQRAAPAARPSPTWVHTIGYAVGRSARFASDQSKDLVDTASRVMRHAFRPSPRVANPSDTARLVRDLVRLLSAHAQAGFRAVQRDPEFWAIVDQLRRRDPRPAGGRRTSQTYETAAVSDTGARSKS